MNKELKALLEETAGHAAERKVVSIHKEQTLLDLVTDSTPTRPGSKAEAIEAMREDLYHLYPNLTDEDLWEIVQTT